MFLPLDPDCSYDISDPSRGGIVPLGQLSHHWIKLVWSSHTKHVSQPGGSSVGANPYKHLQSILQQEDTFRVQLVIRGAQWSRQSCTLWIVLILSNWQLYVGRKNVNKGFPISTQC